jgi:2-oxoglutarate dehydrogenase E2 component (dihydrolipoamide succinyltransferase)
MKTTELKKFIKDAVREAIQEELKEILLEAVRSPKQVVRESYAPPAQTPPPSFTQPTMDLRSKYKDAFAKHHDVNLGFMSFFTKAVTEALNIFPAVNGMIDGNEIVYHNYADIGVAVSSPKGLMVPVVRNAEQMSLAEIEKEIKRLAIKARDGKITPDEMTGGTFTITNGGVFGSMLSTPIINPPQSAILGMHNIVERPVAINGKVEIRPIMYLALSYDHRIIDGKESVGFLVKVKEMLENPERMLFGAKDPHAVLLGL